MLGIIYALAIASGVAIALAIYLTVVAALLRPLPEHPQGVLQVPADGGRGNRNPRAPQPRPEAASAPVFAADPHDPDMVLPAAWPAPNVTDMNGRPYFVGRG